jgi:WD40 repeat protein
MAEVFISYARADQGFARDLNNALQKLNRDTWIDWRSIPDSAEWRAEIFAAVEAAENFLFIISPDSLRPESFCGPEVAHAFADKKRIITILYHPVDRNKLYPELGEIQWINYPELGFEETFGRLIAAIDTDREWVREHTLLKDKARGWNSKGRNDSFLLRGLELQEAVAWLAKATVVKAPRLLSLQEEFIRASQEHEAREVVRLERIAEQETELRRQAEELAEKQAREADKLRRRALVLGGALLLALVAVVTAFHQRQVARAQARVANSGRLATAALLMANSHLDLASLLSIEAFRLSPTFEARNALLTLFQTEPRLLTHLGHDAPVIALAFSRDGLLLATVSNDRRIYLWNLATRRLVGRPIALQTEVDTVAINSDGSSLAFPEENLIHLWDVARNQPKGKPLKGHKTAVKRLLFSPDDHVLASADEHGTVGVWDLTLEPVKGHSLNDYFSNNGRPLYLQGDHHPPPVISMAFKSSGEELLCAYNDGATVRWDLTRKPARGTIQQLDNDKGLVVDLLTTGQVRKGKPTVVRGAFGNDATILAAASGLAGTTLWDAEGHIVTGSSLMLWDTSRWMPLGNLGADCCDLLAFSSDNKMLASVTDNLYDKPLELWDVKSRQKLGEPLVGHNGGVNALAFSSKGTLASAGDDGRVILWDPSGREEPNQTLKGHTRTVESIAFSPDGKTLASGGDDDTVRLWDFVSRKQFPASLMKHKGPVYGVAFSPDGKILASASGDHTIRLWDVAARKPIGDLSRVTPMSSIRWPSTPVGPFSLPAAWTIQSVSGTSRRASPSDHH